MTKAKCLFDFKRLTGIMLAVVMGAGLAACGNSAAHIPATADALDRLPYIFQYPAKFLPFDAADGAVTLLANADSDSVPPTVLLDVKLVPTNAELDLDKYILGDIPSVGEFKRVTLGQPYGGLLAGKVAVVLTATAYRADDSRPVKFIQIVSSQKLRGYARFVAFADEERFPEYEAMFKTIAASMRIKPRLGS